MKRKLDFIAGLILYTHISALINLSFAQESARYEVPPHQLSASHYLSPTIIKGPHHQISENVTSNGYFNTYQLSSPFANLKVEGRPLLEIRVAEMAALAELDKLSSSKVFGDAAYKAGKGLVLAPIKIVEKTAKTISDPEKLGNTLAAVPEGASKLLSWAYRQGKSAVNTVGDAFSSNGNSENKSSSKDSANNRDEQVSKALDQGAKFGLQYLGYTKRQREWFRKLQVNPYTSNTTLRDEVMRVAGIETAVGTAFKFVPGLGLLGELSTFNQWADRAEKLALYEDPDTIGKKNQGELASLGVPQETITAFLNNPAYTPWTRRFITDSLRVIGTGTSGHGEFIKVTSLASDEPATLFFVSAAEKLQKINSRSRLKKLVASTHLPAGVSSDGVAYIPIAIDHLFWTKEIAMIFKDLNLRLKRESKLRSKQILLTGKISDLALVSLQDAGFTVIAETA